MFGSDWNGEKVRERLEVAFRSIQVGVYSPRESVFESTWAGPVDGAELIAAAHHFLGRRAPDTVKLLTYCRVCATGSSWSAICVDMGWDRKTARRRALLASDAVAAALNARASVEPRIAEGACQ